ncbi:cysteine--tRNA ligase [Trueperella pecoris]|uniref:Cysteine--tRNA ligase n=1 Tax=Trueperella pecoris TaxID=2733571 RepID=A0A7M1QXN9_9ACTO|nr:cysteine--tRNA ligase [Trueperella pecoris]QOQ39806.1 cysteine--tRNA ligase [Trueperella pecoris]QOR46698.1 cysteine--tRNA ligase [Trueperella pecoris]QTG76484.1 cysteine--tRNA ligase [Trueperella pecoris]
MVKIFDSKTKSLRDFTPLNPGKVGIYLCGATVQGSPHIGHMRSALAFDVLVRWLKRSGYEVTMVRNVTDIDDKILAKSAEAGAPWWAWAYRFENEFAKAYRALGVLDPTYEPRATGHVPEMIDLMKVLIERGHAYAGDSGNVYFDVSSLEDYGSLTNQSVADLHVDDDEAAADKRGPHDFALWKAPKAGEPESASWDTPWGRGRPGWHLECSAMAGKYLGDAFDIHAGGIDLRFPHHENEQAQSHGAGQDFAQYWMHNAWVTIEGEKMSKSLGNSLTVENILTEHAAVIVRLALGTVHYRSTVAYSEATLTEAAAIWDRLAGFVHRSVQTVGEVPLQEIAAVGRDDLPAEFVEALDDDLNVSAGLAVIHEHVTAGNNALANNDHVEARIEQVLVRAMLDVLGLDPMAEPWRHTEASSTMHDALDSLVNRILDERAAARAEKDWARADSLRDSLTQAGIVVEDSAEGARWKVGGDLG